MANKKKTFFNKVLTVLLALGGFAGLLSITDFKIPLNIWIIILISIILLILILHIFGLYKNLIIFFKELKDDIKYIKEEMKLKNGGKNE